MMQIQVPSQLPPDRKIVVLSPSGQQVSVTVPHNVMPGQMLQVQVPASQPPVATAYPAQQAPPVAS